MMSERNASAAGLLWNPGRYWGMTEASCWLSDSFLPLQGKGGKEGRKWRRGSARLDRKQTQPHEHTSTIWVCSPLSFFPFGPPLEWSRNRVSWLINRKVIGKEFISRYIRVRVWWDNWRLNFVPEVVGSIYGNSSTCSFSHSHSMKKSQSLSTIQLLAFPIVMRT